MSESLDLPRKLGPYRLLRRLGKGGMAEVFLATVYGASGFEKRVAIKVLLPELQGDGRFESLLIEEAKLGARLSHTHLIQVHDLGVSEGVYYVRMDWVDGDDLASLLQRLRLPTELALLLAEQVSAALEYVHSLTDDVARPLGLVHCDVSPSNVLLSRAGEVKLADLGIARATLLAQNRFTNIRRGKYPYMSPEQVEGRSLGPRSDQFGFGVMLVELLTGRRPFDGDTPERTLERIRACATPALPDVDEDLAAIDLALPSARPRATTRQRGRATTTPDRSANSATGGRCGRPRELGPIGTARGSARLGRSAAAHPTDDQDRVIISYPSEAMASAARRRDRRGCRAR